MNKEIWGIIATVFIIASMTFNSTTKFTNILMRVLNTIGSIFFVIYGIILPAYSTAVLNGLCCVVNIYNIFILLRNKEVVNDSRLH